MSLREEIDRAPSDMSADNSTNTSFVMEETTTVDPVEYTKDKIFDFLYYIGDKDVISSVNDRYFIANQTLSTIKTISLEDQNNVLIAVLLSIFKEFEFINFKFDIKDFTNIPTAQIEEMLYLITNKSSIPPSYESYKLIPRCITILIDSDKNTIMKIINSVDEINLYNELSDYIDLIDSYHIDIDNIYIKDIYDSNIIIISKIKEYMKNKKNIRSVDIKNILNISNDL